MDRFIESKRIGKEEGERKRHLDYVESIQGKDGSAYTAAIKQPTYQCIQTGAETQTHTAVVVLLAHRTEIYS